MRGPIEFCSHVRAKRQAATLVILALILCGCSTLGYDAPRTPPPDQAAFLAAQAAFLSAYQNTDDDVVKAKLEQEWRNKDSCTLVSTPAFENWTGTVVGSASRLVVDIGNGVTLKEEAGAPPSPSLSTGLQNGDAVTISGTFVSDDPDCPAQYVGPPWDEKAINGPDYWVRLSSVQHQHR
jgi:hypothetical protein